MSGQLLETKLRVPRRRGGLVARPRLVERLNRAGESALTLVSAPAGFGKTTLLTDCLTAAHADGRGVAWLSLDHRDNDQVVFWTYLIAALQTAVPGVGAGALQLLASGRAPTDEVLSDLLNDLLHAVSNEVVLVLDDYHVIDARDVHDGMSFLLEHLPAHVHLVIASRSDPALPLARLRARGELVEIRASDLRFTPEEAAAYLNEVMGLALTAQDAAALAGRTEGWIAALQLAALSMQGRSDVSGFIAGFAGDDRYIVDYLAEEVLARQPAHVRSFLLETSILRRLSGPLCDAVTGSSGGNSMLEALDRGNLFLVALDDRRHWYRYHHLFADVLRVRLVDSQPDRVHELHRRAGDWFERNADRPEAIDHAMAAQDWARAADLVELALPAMRQDRQIVTMLRWLDALPKEVVRVRPMLSLGYAAALMGAGEFGAVAARLVDAERWLEPAGIPGQRPEVPSEQLVVVDEEGFRGLPSGLAMYRAGLALIAGDVPSTITHAHRALDLVAPGDHFGRGAPSGLLGLAYWRSGDLGAAHRWFADSMASLERAGHLVDAIGGAVTLADIEIAQGHLREAMTTYQRGLQRAAELPTPVLAGMADLHVALSQLLVERDELGAAQVHLRSGSELGEHASLRHNRHRRPVAMASIRQAEGDLSGALDLLDEAERLQASGFAPDVRPIPALRARVWLAQGRLGEALAWAHERGLTPRDALDYLREFEHITLARVLLAQHVAGGSASALDQATRLLARLLPAAEQGRRMGSVIEILMLASLAHQGRGDTPAAVASLQRAVTLAEPEGYIRVFADAGPALAPLLRVVTKQGISPAYARRLLTAATRAQDDAPGVRAGQGLIEPLSDRELDVLRLLGSELSGPDIARELFVSLNTVRTHTRSIYAKLGVSSRRAAVRRAEELDLLRRTSRTGVVADM